MMIWLPLLPAGKNEGRNSQGVWVVSAEPAISGDDVYIYFTRQLEILLQATSLPRKDPPGDSD